MVCDECAPKSGVYHLVMQHEAPDLILQGTPAYRRMSVALLMAGFSTFALMSTLNRSRSFAAF